MQLPHILQHFEIPINVASQALLKNKVRTLLSILGVVIGIASVVIVLSAGQAIKNFLINQLTSFGTNFIQVEIKVPTAAHTSTENISGLAMGVQVTTLKLSDLDEIKKIENISNAYAGTMSQAVVSYKDISKQTFIFATSSSFIDIDPIEVETGRYFSDEEDKSLAKVAVLGNNLKNTLFGDDEAIGKDIKVGKQSYQVIGVLEKKGSSFAFDFDSMLFLPIRTTTKLLMGVDYITFIFAQVYDNKIAEATAEEIRILLREHHDITDPNKDDFAVTTMEEGLNILNTVVGAITLLLFAIAGISLVVGGIGIMNIMYVSVAERTFEIGLRKSVGATKLDILGQFLMEAIFITFSGGIIGIIIGSTFSFLITIVANYLGYNWQFYLSPLYFVYAAGVSILVGLISGLYPARTASNLDPIVALRQE